MTNEEYAQAFEAAKNTYHNLTVQLRKKIKEIYEKAISYTSGAIRKAKKLDRSTLTVASWQNINISLRNGAEAIQEGLEDQIYFEVEKSTSKIKNIDIKFLKEAINQAEADKIPIVAINDLYVAIDENLIRSFVSRVYQDGYTFSQRVWNVGKFYQDQIKDVISAGLLQGRDVISIAKDLQIYIKKGQEGLITQYAKRYGENLKPGTKEYLRRLYKKVDFRALRLARSELYASLQHSALEHGRINPACTGYYDWVRTTTEHYNCTCPELERNGPYEYNKVPGYPHPNCLCYIRPVLRKHKNFVNDLVAWSNGEQVPYLDNWYNNILKYYL